MKRKGLIISAIFFFLLINTTYYWESNLGIFDIPVVLLLIIVYLVFVGVFFRDLFFTIKERFSNKQHLFTTGLLAFILISAFLQPNGIINFDRLEGKNILIAQAEGAANCMTTLKLKSNNKFIENAVCFGSSRTKGKYKLKGDTIFFTNVLLGRHTTDYYKYALIKKTGSLSKIVRYKNSPDSIGNSLRIIKNDLPQ